MKTVIFLRILEVSQLPVLRNFRCDYYGYAPELSGDSIKVFVTQSKV
jgi:hypothetical protein